MTDRVRWETALRALRMLAATMTPHDRVTLIGFAEHATMLAEDATAAQLAEFANGNSLPLPQGNANWPAAWRAAVDAAQAAAGPTLRRVVFLSPLEVEWTSAAIGEAAVALGKLHETQTPWHFIHVSTVRPPDPLAQLADKAQGQLATGSNASQIHAALAQALTGRSGIVATGASVKLAFNPKAVSGYRLVGHEATTLTGEATDPLEIDLASGEQVVGFYELWVKPSSDQLIATVELTWRDGASGQPRKASQAIRRSQLIESFAGAPHWLQQGIVAAKAAEVLRGSHYAPTVRPYGQIRELAGQVDRQAAEQRSFQQLVELVEAAEKLR
jgi:Ca-activated chloride channel family protein